MMLAFLKECALRRTRPSSRIRTVSTIDGNPCTCNRSRRNCADVSHASRSTRAGSTLAARHTGPAIARPAVMNRSTSTERERHRVERRHAKQHRRHHPAQAPPRGRGQRWRQIAMTWSALVATIRITSRLVAPSTRRTASSFVALLHGIRQDAEHADHRQDQRQAAKVTTMMARKRCRPVASHATSSSVMMSRTLTSCALSTRPIALPHRSDERLSTASSWLDGQEHVIYGRLRQRHIELQERLALVRLPLDLLRDADDFADCGLRIGLVGWTQSHSHANRRATAEQLRTNASLTMQTGTVSRVSWSSKSGRRRAAGPACGSRQGSRRQSRRAGVAPRRAAVRRRSRRTSSPRTDSPIGSVLVHAVCVTPGIVRTSRSMASKN